MPCRPDAIDTLLLPSTYIAKFIATNTLSSLGASLDGIK